MASRRLRVYTRFPPIEPCRSVVFLGDAPNDVLLLPARTERLHSSRAPPVFQTAPHRGGHFVQFPITAESTLPRGNGQRLDPPYHGSKQSPREMTLGQQQPVIGEHKKVGATLGKGLRISATFRAKAENRKRGRGGDTMKFRWPNRVRFASTNSRWFCGA